MGAINGALPKWATLVVIGFTLAGGWWDVKSAVRELHASQDQTKTEIAALRAEMRADLATRAELTALRGEIATLRADLGTLDARMWSAKADRNQWDWMKQRR